MEYKYQFLLDDVDITSKVIKAKFIFTNGLAIDAGTLRATNSLNVLVKPKTGSILKVYRGILVATEKKKFEGTVTVVDPRYNLFDLTLKGKLFDLIKNGRTKSWDINIDPELGIGSEIIKDIFAHSSIAFTPAKTILTDGSIQCTGTTALSKIQKFIQDDEDDYDRVMEIASNYNYVVSYNYNDDLANFKPNKFIGYPIPLTIGKEIAKQIPWVEDMEQLANKIKVIGATVLDTKYETFTSAATYFELNFTPETTEVRIDSTTTNTLQTRGQKGVGTIGTDFDYYVDVETKIVHFDSNVSDVTVKYGAKVPLPIILKNETSIETYGGPNKIPHFKKLELNDIKDLEDGIQRGKAYLNKYSKHFVYAEGVSVKTEVTAANGDFEPGMLVTIIDPFVNKEEIVAITEVEINYPSALDTISVGDEVWRTEDYQASQLKRINQLFKELYKNEKIIYQIVELNREIEFKRRYFKLEKNDVTTFLTQGNKRYDELFFDDDFFDSVNSGTNVNINHTDKTITIPSGEAFYSKTIELNTSRISFILSESTIVNVDAHNITYEITGDGGTTWQEFKPLIKGYFSTPSTDIRIKITNEAP